MYARVTLDIKRLSIEAEGVTRVQDAPHCTQSAHRVHQTELKCCRVGVEITPKNGLEAGTRGSMMMKDNRDLKADDDQRDDGAARGSRGHLSPLGPAPQ